jgi:RNA polymerase sigma-70 factor (ECF subfamily)
VARLVATAHALLADDLDTTTTRALDDIERELTSMETRGPAYASRDAGLALADLEWRTGRREKAAGRYRDLAEVVAVEPLRRFCLRRAGLTPR